MAISLQQNSDPAGAFERIVETRIVAILRAEPAEALPRVAEELVSVGVDVIEVPVTVPGAFAALRATRRLLGDSVCLGAGSVVDIATATTARDAGCEYLVSPCVDVELIEWSTGADLPMLAGALSPVEVLEASHAGSPLVKVFPGDLGGPDWLRLTKEQLPHACLLPTGGIDASNAKRYLDAGALALGVGSAIAPKSAIANGDWKAVREAAARIVEATCAAQ